MCRTTTCTTCSSTKDTVIEPESERTPLPSTFTELAAAPTIKVLGMETGLIVSVSLKLCVCDANCAVVNVCVSEPPVSPKVSPLRPPFDP